MEAKASLLGEESRAAGASTRAFPAQTWATMAGLLASLILIGAAAAFGQRGEAAADAAVAAAVVSAQARPAVRLGTATIHSLLSSDGVSWRCSTLNSSGVGETPTLIEVAARVPGVAHEALRAAGMIGDPQYRFNELAYRWVALAHWNFSADFTVQAASSLLIRPAPSLSLRLSGVDTFCALHLNGQPIGLPLDSALLTHDVRLPPGALRPGSNRLVLAFSPPLAEAALRASAYPYPVPHTLYYHTWSEPSHRNFVRKPQSDFGWDWGPSLLPTGPTGRVEIRASGWGEAELAGVGVAQEHTAEGAVGVRVTGWLEGGEGIDPADAELLNELELRVEICHPSCAGSPTQRVVRRGRLTPPPGHHASAAASAAAAPPLLISAPRLWWPRGYGSPEMYDLVATLCHRGWPSKCGEPLRRRIGLRRVELVQEPAPSPQPGAPNGTSFYFRVNGVAIFAKGANAIPSHVFASAEASAAGDDRWRSILRRAAAAHMNMVRVWGGGRYQTEAFYKACDELGLMVWQEFSFACALYPRDEAFLALVRREVVEHTARLGLHPSVVVWGANNENEQALGW
jgi:beta-mannosidase